MSCRPLFVVAIMLLIPLVAAAVAAPPPARPEDYAYGRPLNLPPGSAVGECELPLGVYQRTITASLGDLAVFNALGETVPFQIVSSPQPPPETGAAVVIPFFPLPQPASADSGEGTFTVTVGGERSHESVMIRKEGGAVVQQHAYLLDLRALNEPIERLELDWSGAEGVFPVAIAAGDEPGISLQPIGSATIYRLQYGDRHIASGTIRLPAVQRRVLRIAINGAPESLRLDGVRGFAPPATAAPQFRQLTLAASPDGPDAYRFTLPGALPLARLHIRAPQPNTLAQITLFSRPLDDGPWIRRGGGAFYDLQVSGTVLRSPDFAVHGQDRYWRLTVDSRGGGFGAGVPQIEADWLPQRLRFVARGTGPFLLAYGSGRVERQQSTATVLPLGTGAGDTIAPGLAVLGPEELLGGDEALRARISPQRWKTVVLWSALVGSVLLLAAMAISLHRRLGAEQKRAE